MICGEFSFEDDGGGCGNGGSGDGGNGGNIGCGGGQEKTPTTNFNTEVVVVATVVGRIAKLKYILGGAGCGISGCYLVVVIVGEVVEGS